MIKRVLTILFLLLANSVLLGHSIIIHHHHYDVLAVEDILHDKQASEHFHHEHQLPEHCHLFNNNEYYFSSVNQINTTKRIKHSIDYMLFGFEKFEPNNLSESKYLIFDLIRITKTLCKQRVIALRGPPIV